MQLSPALAYAIRDLEVVEKAMPYVADRSACVQAGACLGTFPQHLAGFFGAVYAFEPDPGLLRRATDAARAPNIYWYCAALGSKHKMVGTSRARRDGSTRPTHEGLTHVVPGGRTPTLRIDDFCLPSLGLIQLDVEGHELFALQGARETILRCRPVLVLEINKQIRYSGVTEEDLRTHVRMLGYEQRLRCNSDEVFTPC